MMKWSKEKEATRDIPYNHITLTTPIGEYIIDWKGWKERPSYDIYLEGIWVASELGLDEAKEAAEDHLKGVYNDLTKLLNNE